MHVEGRAVLAGQGVLGRDRRAVGGVDLQGVQPHRIVVGIEQLVGDGGVDGDPRILARDHGEGRQQPPAVSLGGQRQGEGGRSGGQSEQAVAQGHGDGLYFTVRVTAPSSDEPLAEAVWPPLAGQVNGTRTVSWPPTSRAASATRLY